MQSVAITQIVDESNVIIKLKIKKYNELNVDVSPTSKWKEITIDGIKLVYNLHSASFYFKCNKKCIYSSIQKIQSKIYNVDFNNSI